MSCYLLEVHRMGDYPNTVTSFYSFPTRSEAVQMQRDLLSEGVWCTGSVGVHSGPLPLSRICPYCERTKVTEA